jgi:hypothetical protein
MKTPQQSEEDVELYNIFADATERAYKKTLPRYTDKELLQIFSPAIETICVIIEQREKERRIRTKRIKVALENLYAIETDDFSHWFGERMIQLLLYPDLEKCVKHIVRLKRLLNLMCPQDAAQDTNDEALQKARQYPISEISKGRLMIRECGNKFSALCPFHEEKHASFYIYPETNTFHCFGCQENGDVIKLAMYLYGVSFPEAVKMLQ